MSMTPQDRPAARRRGRRPGPSKTRGKILDAARTCFARDGFAAATIRKIAEDAGVDASLVMQFYGTKDELFAAVMSISPAMLSRYTDAFKGPKHTLGERVARAFFEVWEGDPQDSDPMLAILRSSVSNKRATALLRGFLEARYTVALGVENAIRVGIASSMLVGVMVGRRILQMPTLVNEEIESLVALIAPALQAILAADCGACGTRPKALAARPSRLSSTR